MSWWWSDRPWHHPSWDRRVAGWLLLADERGQELARKYAPSELTDRGLGIYGMLWPETILFHARKHLVAWEMMRKYNDSPLQQRHPCLIPGFLFLLPELAAALPVAAGASQKAFPQWEPPGRLGDWKRLS